MFTLTQCLFGLLVALITYFYISLKKTYRYWSDRGVKHSKPTPIFGNWYPVIAGKSSLSAVLDKEYKKFQNEKYIGMYVLTSPSLIVKDPDYAQRILVKDFSCFVDRVHTHGRVHPLEESIVVLQGNRWRAIRKSLIPVFTSSKIKGMFPQAMKCGEKLVTFVQSTQQTEFRLKDLMAVYSANVIANVAFGIDLGDELNRSSEFIKHAKNVFIMSVRHRVCFILSLAFPWLMGNYRVSVTNPTSAEYFGRLLRDALDERLRSEEESDRRDLLSLLLQMREKGTVKVNAEDPEDSYLKMDAHESVVEEELTDELLMAQAYIFLVAGFDTTSTALEFALFELSMNPEVQDKLRNEVLDVLNKEGNNFSYKSLAKMTYLDQCMKEILRKYPGAALHRRICTKEYDLDGLKITPGQAVFVPVHSIHYDPHYYPEPEKFKPERFETEPAKGTYTPFGDGPRMCIGMRVAQMNLKLGILNIVKNFKIEPSSKNVLPLKFKPSTLLLMPKENLWCHLIKI